MKDPSAILITGASSGIGAALAREYAAPGVALSLSGRNAGRLGEIAAACRTAGATVDSRIVDVTDRDAVRGWIEDMDALAPLDLVIANAGISGGTGGAGGEDEDAARRIFAVNVDGVMNTVLPAIAPMGARGRGQVALMSSLAGFRGMPGAPAYSASKAAVRAWGEALRGAVAGDGIELSVICPGYIETPMTATNSYPMPLLMTAARAARIIRRGLARNRGRIAFPLPLYLVMWLIGAAPPGITDPLMRRLPKKN
jgi:short-subunit dehydrogenase